MTEVASFFNDVLGTIAGTVVSTYIVRLIDKILHKNNRHE